jgi:hypothetical protein
MESVRQPIVDLIYEVLNGTPPIFINGIEDQKKARLANQLIKSGYLDGSPAIGGQGQIIKVAIVDVTIEGRKFCENLEEEIRNSTVGVKTGKTLKKVLLILLGAIGGIVITVVTQWVLARMNLK